MWDINNLARKKPGSIDSLLLRAPNLVSEWDVTGNYPFLPRDVHAGSPRKAWWCCSKGHVWFSSIRERVRRKTGCPFCNSKLASSTNCIAAISQRAVSLWHPTKNAPDTPWTIMPNSCRKVWWVCDQGHEWQTSPNLLVGHNSGCPRCVKELDSKGERACRDLIEALTGFSFPKAKPAWLRSSRGFQMELDGYCQELGLAFEHQGVQHYQHTPFFHRVKRLDRIQELDAEKLSLCLMNNVCILEVRWDCSDLKAYLRSKLRDLGFATFLGGV